MPILKSINELIDTFNTIPVEERPEALELLSKSIRAPTSTTLPISEPVEEAVGDSSDETFCFSLVAPGLKLGLVFTDEDAANASRLFNRYVSTFEVKGGRNGHEEAVVELAAHPSVVGATLRRFMVLINQSPQAVRDPAVKAYEAHEDLQVTMKNIESTHAVRALDARTGDDILEAMIVATAPTDPGELDIGGLYTHAKDVLGFTGKEMARVLGVSEGTYYRYQNSRGAPRSDKFKDNVSYFLSKGIIINRHRQA